MPATPLVFELFIYNSIYQVDWPASLKARRVENPPRDVEHGFSETKQQRELERFLKLHVRDDPALLYKAPLRLFRPQQHLPWVQDHWRNL